MKEILAAYMKEKRLTQAGLARKLRVSTALVSYYLNGKRKPGTKVALRISELTGVPVLELLYTKKELELHQ